MSVTNTDYTVEFAGLAGTDTKMSESIMSHYKLSEQPIHSLLSAIGRLDPVELANLYIQNPYNESQLIPYANSNATVNPDTAIDLASKPDVTEDDGDLLAYAVHGQGYAAVAHYDFFSPLAMALMDERINDISGQFRVYDNGARVHGELMFQDPDTQLNLPDDRDPLFVGISFGNSYDGSSSMYAMGYAMDTYCKNSMRNLTDKRTRRHIGNPASVSEWWGDMLVRMTAIRDILGECIEESLEVELNFMEQPFSVEELYELLGIPSYLARAAATSARNRSPMEGGSRSVINFWTLHSGLTSALTHDFNGSSEIGSLETYSQIAKDMLWNPQNVIASVKSAYERREREQETVDESAVSRNIAVIERYERSLEDRKNEFESFEARMNTILSGEQVS